ncbi:MAG: hypothetical protein EOO39_50050 [Cytophagaceae bacterium]|nr:MAG: hypothetical protein EOO39_50050 [Cytophagaceae bacterium]
MIVSSFVRATIRHIYSVEPCDHPDDFHNGPEFDSFTVTVDHGPTEAFLSWFHQTNRYGLCRVGNTAEFIDFGSSDSLTGDLVIELTFEQFFPQWLEHAESLAKASVAAMAKKALSSVQ